MTQQNLNEKISSLKSGWYVWLFPLIAVVFSGWLLMNYYDQRGKVITISFEDASSIQAEKTKVLYRGVAIGSVTKVAISEDNRRAVATVNLQRDAKHFAVKGSRFWVVTPKVGLQGISGLETIFQGAYITVDPGDPKGASEDDFKGYLNAETSEPTENTSSYSLETRNVESVSVGDSVTFRGIKIGSVTDVGLNKSAQLGVVKINIANRYVKLIRTNTVFWRKVGIQANLGLFGSEVKVGSLDSIMRGGVDLFTPTEAGEVAKAGARYELRATPPKDWEKWNPNLDL